MRPAIAGALLALASFALFFFFPQAPEEAAGAMGEGGGGIWYPKPFIASYGGEDTAVIGVFAPPSCDCKAYADIANAPFPSAIRYLEGKGAGATSAGELREAAGRIFSRAGIAIEDGKWEGIMQGSGIAIAPTGAFPSEIFSAVQKGEYPSEGQALIYVGLDDGSELGAGGAVRKNESLAKFLSAPQGENGVEWREIRTVGGGRIYVFPKVPDEYSPEGLARSFAQISLGMGMPGQARTEKNLGAGENTLTVKTALAKAYGRVAIIGKGGIMNVHFFGPMHRLAGKLEGQREAGDGNASFRAVLSPLFPQEENLELFAATYSWNGSAAGKEKIFEGKIRERWIGAFSLPSLPFGPAIVQVEDQYGRQHARAYVERPKLDAALAYSNGREKEFVLRKDGELLPDGQVMVRKGAAGEWSSARISGGKVLLSSKWGAGENVVEFSADGMNAKVSFAENGGNWQAPMKFLLAGLLLAAALFFALRREDSPKFRITCNAMAGKKMPKMPIGRKKLSGIVSRLAARSAWGVADFESIGAEVASGCRAIPSEESLRGALGILAGEGAIAAHGSHYAPKKNGAGAKVRLGALSSRLNDALVQQGIDAWHEGNGFFIEKNNPVKRAWQVFAPGARPRLRGHETLTLVFENAKERAEFERRMHRGDREGAMAWIAFKSGKLEFATLEKTPE